MAEYITKKIRDLNDFTQINPMTTGDHLVVASSEGTPSTNKATIKDVVGLYLESSSEAGKWSDGVIAGDIYYNAGNVGIGTTSPNHPLHVNENVNGVSETVLFSNFDNTAGTNQAVNFNLGLARNSGSQKTAFQISCGKEQDWTNDDSKLDSYAAFATLENNSLSERMRITSSGRVGIGTTDPQAKFNVSHGATIAGTNLANASILVGTTANGIGIDDNEIVKKGGFAGAGADLNIASQGVDGIIKFKTGADSNNNNEPYERMIIDSDGSVGIGTTNPSAVFECKKNATGPVHLGRFTNANGQAIVQIRAKNDNLSILEFADSEDGNVGAINYSHVHDYMRFKTSDIERVAIDSSGNVGISTMIPQAALHIERSDDNVVHSKITNTSTAVNSIGASVIEGLRAGILQLTCFSAGTDAKSFNISSQSGLLTIDLISDDGSTATRLLDLDTNGNLRIKGTLTENATF